MGVLACLLRWFMQVREFGTPFDKLSRFFRGRRRKRSFPAIQHGARGLEGRNADFKIVGRHSAL